MTSVLLLALLAPTASTVTLHMVDGPLRDVAVQVVDVCEMDKTVVAEDLDDKVTFHFDDVPCDVALKALFSTKKLVSVQTFGPVRYLMPARSSPEAPQGEQRFIRIVRTERDPAAELASTKAVLSARGEVRYDAVRKVFTVIDGQGSSALSRYF